MYFTILNLNHKHLINCFIALTQLNFHNTIKLHPTNLKTIKQHFYTIYYLY